MEPDPFENNQTLPNKLHGSTSTKLQDHIRCQVGFWSCVHTSWLKIFWTFFILSLQFKYSIIVPVLKKSAVTCMTADFFIHLHILSHIKDVIPTTLDWHQFTYRKNRSAEDAVSLALHTVLTHLEHPNSYVRMSLVDFSWAHTRQLWDSLQRGDPAPQ